MKYAKHARARFSTRQIVYEGVYVRSEEDTAVITAEKLIDNTVPRLSGAPVIDGKGHLVGLMSRGKGEFQRLSPVEYPLAFLKRRATQQRSHRRPEAYIVPASF
jgi:hypothetical protein